MKIKLIPVITIISILQACSPTNSKIETENKQQQTPNICTDSLFINFCTDINSSQYKLIESNLFSEHKLLKTDSLTGYILNITERDFTDTTKLKTTEILFGVNPIFINDSLKSISLVFNSIANHLPKNRIGLYNKNIKSLYESKYGSPEVEEITSQNKILYTWQLQKKVVKIVESYQLEWDVLKKENYKVLSPFEIIYESKTYFISQNKLKIETDKKNRNIEINKQTKTLKEI